MMDDASAEVREFTYDCVHKRPKRRPATVLIEPFLLSHKNISPIDFEYIQHIHKLYKLHK